MSFGMRRLRQFGAATGAVGTVAPVRGGRRRDRDRHRSRPSLLPLEDRQLLSTLTVTSTADSAPAYDPAPGTLRWAVEQADISTSPTTIDFNLGSAPTTITLEQGELELSNIADAITIAGTGANLLTISGNDLNRVFQVGEGVTASLSGLTITGGSASGQYGGGLDNQGFATLTSCVISGNSAQFGGGLANDYGTLKMSECTVSGNTSTLGGGLFSDGSATLTDCTLSDNDALYGGGSYSGGSIALTACTVSGNTASGLSTTGQSVGGLANFGAMTLTACTVSNNTGGFCGGLVNVDTATLIDTIVAGNTDHYYAGEPNIFDPGSQVTGSYNLIGTGSSGGLTSANHNLLNVANPMLGPLANNGGQTETMALLSGSPAIQAGVAVSGLTTDQRGLPNDTPPDIGAYQTSPTATASFLKQDATTQGSWIGTYGGQGYDIVSGPTSLPSYASVTPSGQTTYTWTTTSSDPRALQVPGSSNRVAAVWFSKTSFSVDVNLNDGKSHDLELYFDDWDSLGRAETVQISNAAGTVLSTESISSFSSGLYLDWQVSGKLVITITRTAGPNAVLNGLFIDPTATASFLKQDTTTQGSWIGTYGGQGYDIVSGPTSLPSYASVTPSGQTTYTWTTTSSDPRALQVPGSSNRVAAVWFSKTSFSVDVNLNDGKSHDLELYFDDWDSLGRAETVQISNAAGTVLSTESISSFSSGLYLDWQVSGKLVITITRTAGPNAVLNGLFIDPTATASFLKQDTTTQGSWIGTYGAQGYDIVSGPSSLPSYASVTPSGETTYTWTTTSKDRRALQVPGSSDRVAAVWFSKTSFTVDVEPVRRQEPRPRALLRRLGQPGPLRDRPDQQRIGHSALDRDDLVVLLRALPGLAGLGRRGDHDHPHRRPQRRPQRLVHRPGDHTTVAFGPRAARVLVRRPDDDDGRPGRVARRSLRHLQSRWVIDVVNDGRWRGRHGDDRAARPRCGGLQHPLHGLDRRQRRQSASATVGGPFFGVNSRSDP